MDVQQTQSSAFHLSKESDYYGLDLQAAQTWIYPTNYPVREYQLNIIQNALFKNTLVSLPTGLGKTFIAAVVMYNFFRWYPECKVVFMAPTRPLVKQQVDACYDIMAIPKKTTAELTGTNLSGSREDIWRDKRVFFITPQILQNDLERIADIGVKIRCLVFDEAHKARGKHSYCEVIRKLTTTNKCFRVLALSATPGASITDVLEVVNNLLISHLEFRTEESLDVQPYVFNRNVTTVVVPLGEKLQQIKDDYLEVLEYHTRSLIKYKVIPGNWGSLTKGKIFITMKNFQQNRRGSGTPNYGEIMKCLNICVTLYHAYELLVRHGLRSFLTFFEEHIDKPLLRGNVKIMHIMEDVRNYLGPPLNLERLPHGEYTEVSKDVKFGHPKFYKLKEILLDKFKENDNNSKVIVFFEYRDSVMEAFALLCQYKPILKPRIFLGQKNGITQKSQINVVKAFREGTCNILLSTSIGEEGLDVGEVDLIVCFDISNKSPIRMVQRMGRTGRKKEGSIIVLVTEGKEQQTLKDCLIHKNNITQHVLSSSEIAKGLIANCPRMIPDLIIPKCEKMFITVEKTIPKKGATLKDIFRSISSSTGSLNFSPDLEIIDIVERIPMATFLWNKANPLEDNNGLSNIFSKKIQKQRSFQKGRTVLHSKDTEMLVSLLQFSDSKRFNLPLTQIGNASQSGQQKNFKQTDIRNMFFKSPSVNDFMTPAATQVSAKGLTPPPIEEKSALGHKKLFEEISDYLSLKAIDGTPKCRHCPNMINCDKLKITKENVSVNWIELDESVYKSITLEDVLIFKSLLDNNGNNTQEVLFEDDINFDSITIPTQVNPQDDLELDDLIDKSILADFFNESASFQPPKSFKKIFNQCEDSCESKINVTSKSQKRTSDIAPLVTPSDSSNNMSQGHIQDILTFFKVDSLADIYQDEVGNSQDTIILSSPDISKTNAIQNTPISPVLGTFTKKSQVSKPNIQRLKSSVSRIDSPSKFSMNKTKISSTPQILPQLGGKNRAEPMKKFLDTLQLNDLCDVSTFGLKTVPRNMSNTPLKNLCKSSPHSTSEIALVSDSFNFDDFCEPPDQVELRTHENLNGREKMGFSSVKKDLYHSSFSNYFTIVSPKECVSNSSSATQNGTLMSHVTDFSSSPNKVLLKTSKCFEKDGGPQITDNLTPGMKITQLLSMINKPSQHIVQSSPAKQRVQEISDDDFNFSFNEKKTPNKKRKVQEVNASTTDASYLSFVKSPQTSKCAVPKVTDKSKLESGNSSDDDFEPKRNQSSSLTQKPVKKLVPQRKKKKLGNEFIDEEAELSQSETLAISDDEDENAIDQSFDASFIADESECFDTQIQAKYLQSVRSPVINNRGFKMPTRRNMISNVYSQEVNNADDTYLDDSFVVRDESVVVNDDYSELELLEMKLAAQKRKKSADNARPLKRRRIIVDYSDESD